MKVILEREYRKWFQGDNFFSVGYVYVGGDLLEKDRLGNYIYEAIKQDNMMQVLQQSNGCFAVICFVEDKVYLIVDKLRSYPLLYAVMDNDCVITDSANGFKNSISTFFLNEISAAEFLSLGYLSGNKTLLENIFNVEAGSYVVIDKKGFSICLYYEHIQKKQNFQDRILIAESSKKIEEAFKRMLKTVGDKTILIPLSGGYDSRLIACLCKKMNVQNVLCFTYGRKDSFEVAVSKKVADILGFDWCFIEYTQEIINKWINRPIWKEYVNYVGNLNVNPSVQGLFALLELKERKIIDPLNSVFIPGHSGDALGGSHMLPINTMKHKTLEQVLFEQYYRQNNLHFQWKKKLIDLLHDAVGRKKMSTDEKYDKHYSWNARNRQANFIVNSVRTFEFIGSEWRIPLWDAEYSTFWNEVSWDKKRAEIYNRFMFDCYFRQMNVDFIKDSSKQSLVKKIVCMLLPKWLKEKIRDFIRFFSKNIEQPHFNSFDVMVDNLPCSKHEQFCKEIKLDIDSTLSRYYLDFIINQFIK